MSSGGLTPAPYGYPIKLVRDRTPEILNRSEEPGDLWYGECPPELVDKYLRLKLAEEVAEFLVDGGEPELADVFAVVWSLDKRNGWRAGNYALSDARGLFDDAVMMYGRHDEFDRPGVREYA